NTSLGGLYQSRNSPYGVTKAALESATLIFAADLAGTGVTVNSLLPGGACDTDPNRPPDPKLKLLPVDIMNPAIVWLASKRSDGKTGGRYIGRLWNDKLPPDQAAASALADAKCDIIVFHCTGHAMEEGPEGDAWTRAMIKSATGIAAMSTAAAIEEALGVLKLKRLILLTPYDQDTNDHEIDYL